MPKDTIQKERVEVCQCGWNGKKDGLNPEIFSDYIDVSCPRCGDTVYVEVQKRKYDELWLEVRTKGKEAIANFLRTFRIGKGP